MAGIRRSFRWASEKRSEDKKKSTITISIPRSSAGFGFTVAWTKPPQVEFVNEDGTAAKAGLRSGDKIFSIDKITVSKKSKNEVENIVKNVKELMELEIFRVEGDFSSRKRQTSLRRKESFSKKGSKMIIQDTNIMLWRRERALLKLLLCEEDFLDVLSLGKKQFVLPLRKQCSLATTAELHILFGNIDEVFSVHERHVQTFRQLTQGTEDNVGKMYQKQIDERIFVLRKYILGLPFANILLKYKLMNRPFKDFVDALEQSTETMNLLSLIEKPLKYVSELLVTMMMLLSCTAVGHRDYVCLENIISIVRTFETEMIEVMNKLSDYEDLENIDSIFDDEEPYINLEVLQQKTLFTKGPRDFSLIHPGRYWLFSGYLSKIEGRHYIEYWGILLSDCLILARRTEQRVLLILEEPVMLRSIYQATFEIEKCDSEFRILFSIENSQPQEGRRNKWVTWILRASCPGLKLLWQVMITNQLSLFSTQSLTSGKKSSFVHAKQPLGLKSLLPKRNLKYEESSFVTPTSQLSLSSLTSTRQSQTLDLFRNSIKANPSKSRTLVKDIAMKKEKDRSYSSLNEGIPEEGILAVRRASVSRSKSFGNDLKDSIPYIDFADGSDSRTESNIDSVQNSSFDKDSKPELSSKNFQVGSVDQFEETPTVSTSQPGLESALSSSLKLEKLVQTESALASSFESGLSKRSPRKKFPRLGTFERIRIENHRKSTEIPIPSTASKTRTGTSVKHRGRIPTTISKEQLVKPEVLSPILDLQSKELMSTLPSKATVPQKKERGFLSWFWRKEPKETTTKFIVTSAELDNEQESLNVISNAHYSEPVGSHSSGHEELNLELMVNESKTENTS